MATAGTYLPESMLIKLNAGVPFFNELAMECAEPTEEGCEEQIQETRKITAVDHGYLFHEYLHFLHNISTPSGLAALINQIELWRCFRLTVAPGGFSQGSGCLDQATLQHVRVLSSYLNAMRVDGTCSKLKYVMTPARLDIVSVASQVDVAGPTETLLTKLVCKAKVYDGDDNHEECTVEVKTQEIMECIAWRLEKQLVYGMDPDSPFDTPKVFPYRVVEALVRCMIPDIDEETILYCAMASLQSTDAPAALYELLTFVAAASKQTPEHRLEQLRAMASQATEQSSVILETSFRNLENEFSSHNRMASAIREVMSVSRDALESRLGDPVFELALLDDIISLPESFQSRIAEITPCSVLQERDGPEDRVGRDLLVSFREKGGPKAGSAESALRVLHCLFHFLRAHMRAGEGFERTERISATCPFFTCCTLPLRTAEPDLCRKTPWRAVNGNGPDAPASLCWYGAGVHLTRPPMAAGGTSQTA